MRSEAAARGWQLLRPSCPGLEAVGVRLTRLLGGAVAAAAPLPDECVERVVGSLDGLTRHLGESLKSKACEGSCFLWCFAQQDRTGTHTALNSNNNSSSSSNNSYQQRQKQQQQQQQ